MDDIKYKRWVIMMEDIKVRLQNFMEKNRHNIEFIGAQNGKIKEVVALLTNSKPNKNNRNLLPSKTF